MNTLLIQMSGKQLFPLYESEFENLKTLAESQAKLYSIKYLYT